MKKNFIQYTNEIRKDSISIDSDALLNDYDIVEVIFNASVPSKSYYSIIENISFIMAEQTKFFIYRILGKIISSQPRHFYFMKNKKYESTLFSDVLDNFEESVMYHYMDESTFNTLPIEVQLDILLRTCIKNPHKLETGYFSIAQTFGKKKGEIKYIQALWYKFSEGSNKSTLLFEQHSSKYWHYSCFTDYAKKRFVNSDLYMYEGTHLRRYDKTDNIGNAFINQNPYKHPRYKNLVSFDSSDLKSEAKAQAQKIPAFIYLYKDLINSGYLKNMEFVPLEMSMYREESIEHYSKALLTIEDLLRVNEYCLVIGESIPDPEDFKSTLITKLKAAYKNIEPQFKFTSSPTGKTIIFINEDIVKDENGEKVLTASEQDYMRSYPDAIIQHITTDTILSCKKASDISQILENCLVQLEIKEDILLKTNRLIHVPSGKYGYIVADKESWNKEKRQYLRYHQTICNNNKLSYENKSINDNDHATFLNIPTGGKKPDYILVKYADDDMDSSCMVFYQTNCFALPNMREFPDTLFSWVKSQELKISKEELEDYFILAKEKVAQEDDKSELYLKLLEGKKDSDLISISDISGNSTKYKKTLDAILQEYLGVNIILSIKGEEYVKSMYPAFKDILYKQSDNGGEFFIPLKNPLAGYKNNPTNVIKWEYTVKYGEDFIKDVLPMMYNPYISFKKISNKPGLAKYLREWIKQINQS